MLRLRMIEEGEGEEAYKIAERGVWRLCCPIVKQQHADAKSY